MKHFQVNNILLIYNLNITLSNKLLFYIGTADDLTDTLLKCMSDKGLEKNMMVGFSSDTTNAMAGKFHSVFTNLKTAVPGIACIKCSCHMIHLSASKACLKLPRSVEDLLRNVGSHFSRSHSRQTKYKEFQEFFQVEIHKILSPCTTRWLSLKACVDRVLEQFPALKEYFRLVNFEDPSKTSELIYSTMENSFSIIYLEFMSYSLGLLTNFNTLFQGEGPLLHSLKPEVEKLLKTVSMNFMSIEYKRNLDSIINVSPNMLQYYLPLNDIYIGISATDSITNLKTKNVVNFDEIFKFFKSCQEFYIELVVDIKKRFVFDDSVFECITVTNPALVKEFKSKSLAHILKRFPVLHNCINNAQELDKEWRELALMEFEPSNSIDIIEYWRKVFCLKNSLGEVYFPNIFFVMRLLLVLTFSNASVERLFSDLKNIKTMHRNKLKTDSLVGILRTKHSISDSIDFKPSAAIVKCKTWDSSI